MQLVAPGRGWALTKERLTSTSDNGKTWTDITPPGVDPNKLTGTFFLDAQHGWTATIDHTQALQDAPSTVNIFRTIDGGRTWQTSSFEGPPLGQAQPPLFGGNLQFSDPQHGWFAGVYVTGLMHHPHIYRTADGGVSWQEVLPPHEAYDYVLRFIDSHNGWFVSGDPQPISATRDGGASWNSVPLPVPPGCSLTGGEFTAPVFSDSEHGVFSARGGCQNGLVGGTWFYSTEDGGDSWKIAANAPEVNSVSIVDSATWFYVSSDSSQVQLVATRDAGHNWVGLEQDWASLLGTSGDLNQPRVDLDSPAFVTANDGWALLYREGTENGDKRLIATEDGGHTWKLLRP
jgi:photosystem II stability/assembly factor-like uncharacterized protein